MTYRYMKRFILFGVVLLCFGGPISADNGHVSIRRVNVAPRSKIANIVIEVRFEKHEDNREVSVACESDDDYRASSEIIEGLERKSVIFFELSLRPGYYECRGEVRRAGKALTSTHINIPVLF